MQCFATNAGNYKAINQYNVLLIIEKKFLWHLETKAEIIFEFHPG